MRRCFVLLVAAIATVAGIMVAPASAATAPIGRLGDTLQVKPAGSTVSGAVFWDCYRDLVSKVVLIHKITGEHLAQWNV